MSRRSARATYTTFDRERGPEGYTATNLVAFINQAGLTQEMKDALEQSRRDNQEEYAQILGIDPEARDFWTQVSRNRATRQQYINDQQQVRFDLLDDYVAGLPAGETLTLPSAAAASTTSRFVNGDQLISIWNTGGQNELIRTLNETPVDRLRTSGLEQFARHVAVPSASLSKLPSSGDDRRRALVNAILVHLGAQERYSGVPEGTGRATSSRSSRRSTPVVDRQQALSLLQARQISDSLQLLSLSVPELNRLAREIGVSPGKNKSETIAEIARQVGFQSLPTLAEVTRRYNDIMTNANLTNARAAASEMRAEELNMLTSNQLYELYKHLQLSTIPGAFDPSRSRPSKSAIIAYLTRNQSRAGPSAAASRRAMDSVRRDYNACVNADIARVRDVADGLRISYNQYTSKEKLCSDIYAYHLDRVSDILVSNLDNLEAIAANPATAPGRLAVIARNANLDIRPNTVEELLQHWLPSHYGSRAIRLAPGQNAMVTAYIRSGTVPANVRQQLALARVFADIRPDIELMEDDQLAGALQDLYDRFIVRAMAGDIQTIRNQASSMPGRSGYAPNGRPSPRRNASPASQRLSPRRSASPAQSVTQSPRRSASPASQRLSPRRSASPAQSAIQSLERSASPQRGVLPGASSGSDIAGLF